MRSLLALKFALSCVRSRTLLQYGVMARSDSTGRQRGRDGDCVCEGHYILEGKHEVVHYLKRIITI